MGKLYHKLVVDLTAKELMLIYDKHPDKKYPLPIPRFDKSGCVLNLLNIQPDLFDQLDRKYFFRKLDQKIEFDPDFDVNNIQEAVQKTARADHKIDIDKINEIIEMDNLNSILARPTTTS